MYTAGITTPTSSTTATPWQRVFTIATIISMVAWLSPPLSHGNETAPPDAPTGLAAEVNGGEATLTWGAPTNTGSAALDGYRLTGIVDGERIPATDLTDLIEETETTDPYPDGTWTVDVTAVNLDGEASDPSDPVTFTIAEGDGTDPSPDPVDVPAPGNLTADADNGSVLLSWEAPDGYEPDAEGGDSFLVKTSPAEQVEGSTSRTTTDTELAVDGLVGGVEYTVEVRTQRITSEGPIGWSDPVAVTVTPEAGPPFTPAGGELTAGAASLHASWEEPASDGGSAVTGYRLTVVEDPTGAAESSTVMLDTPVTEHTLDELDPGVAYDVEVAALNDVGTGSSRWLGSATPDAEPAAPAAPTDVTAEPGDGQLTVTWDAPDDAGTSPITGYEVTVTPDGGNAQTDVVDGLEHVATGLTNGVEHAVSVVAVNADGASDPSAAVTATPHQLPSAPTDVDVQVDGSGAIVSWGPPDELGSADLERYDITIDPPVGGSDTFEVAASGTSYLITDLEPDVTYTVRVTADTDAGAGTPSAPVTATSDGPALEPIAELDVVKVAEVDTGTAHRAVLVVADGLERQLWASDGTAAGTVRIDDTDFDRLEVMADTGADDVVHLEAQVGGVPQLLATDGTRQGTTTLVADLDALARDVDTDAEAGRVAAFASTGGRTAFVLPLAFSSRGPVLFEVDGSTTGASPLTDLPVDDDELAVVADRLLYVTDDGGQRTLVADDGTGTAVELWSHTDDGAGPRHLTVSGGWVFFAGEAADHDETALWVTDGDQRVEQLTFPEFGSSGDPQLAGSAPLAAGDGRVYVAMFEGDFTQRIWSSDGTLDGTGELWDTDLLGDAVQFVDAEVVVFDGRLVLNTAGAASGQDPDDEGWWILDGDAGAIEQLVDATGEPLDTDLAPVDGGDELWLASNRAVWRTDLTAAGTRQVAPGELFFLGATDLWPVADTLLTHERAGGPSTLSRLTPPTPTWPDDAELRVDDVGASFATASWDPADPAAGRALTGYRLLDADGDVLAEVGPDATATLLDGLEPDTDTVVRVHALGGFAADAPGSGVTVTTTADDGGAGELVPLSADPAAGRTTLSWPAHDDADAGYRVLRGTTDAELAPVAEVTDTAWVDEGPPADTQLTYQVQRDTSDGWQPYTEEVTVTTPSIEVVVDAVDAFVLDDGVVRRGATVTVTAVGDHHRTGTATLTARDTDGADLQLDAALDADAPGIYTATLELPDDVAEVTAAEVQLCDDTAACAADETALTFTVAGGVEVDLGLDERVASLEDGTVTLRAQSAGTVGIVDIGPDGTARVDELAPADDYLLRIVDGDGQPVVIDHPVVVESGRTVTVDIPQDETTLRVSVPVTVVDADGGPRLDDPRVWLSSPNTSAELTTRDGVAGAVDGLVVGDELDVVVDRFDTRCHPGQITTSVVVDGEPIVIEAADAPRATVAGHIRDPEGEKVGANVGVVQQVGDRAVSFRGHAHPDDGYELEVCAADDTQLNAVRGGAAAEERTDIAAGDDNERGLQLIESHTAPLYARTAPSAPGSGSAASAAPPLTIDGEAYRTPFRVERGTSIEVCGLGDGYGLNDVCVDYDVPDVGNASVVVPMPAAAVAVFSVLAFDGGETGLIREGRVHLHRIDGDGTRHPVPLDPGLDGAIRSQQFAIPDVLLPEPGTYQLYVTHPLGRSEVRQFTVDTGDVVQLGALVIDDGGLFDANSSVTASQEQVPAGRDVTFHVALRNTGVTDAAAPLLTIDLPDIGAASPDGVTVDGQRPGDGQVQLEGRKLTVSFDDIPAGERRTVRVRIPVPEGSPAGTELLAHAEVSYDHLDRRRTEMVGSATATVAGTTIDVPATVADRQVWIAGTAVSGEVDIYDGEILLGTATSDGSSRWRFETELVDRGEKATHTLTAVAAGGGPQPAASATVTYDSTAPQLLRGTVDTGLGFPVAAFAADVQPVTFGAMFRPDRPIRVTVQFDNADRVLDPVAIIGDHRRPLTPGDDGTFSTSMLIQKVDQTGPLWIDYDVAPEPLDVDEHVASFLDDDGELDELVVDNRFGDVLPGTEFTDLDQWTDGVPVDDTRDSQVGDAGLDGEVIASDGQLLDIDPTGDRYGHVLRAYDDTGEVETTIAVRFIDDYDPDAAGEARVTESGLPIYELDTGWQLRDGRRDTSVRMVVPEAALPSAVDGMALASRFRAAEFVYNVVDTGATVNDAASALGAGGVFDDIGDIQDVITNECGDVDRQLQYRDRVDALANEALATRGVQAAGMITTGVVAAATGGVGGAFIIGAGTLLDLGLNDNLERQIDELVDDIRNDADCDDEDDEDDDRRPDTTPVADIAWIFDPSGYVFEAVESNRVADATTVVYEGSPSDAGTEPTSWQAWNAEPFWQDNPLTTGADGRYGWDVPRGWWQVTASKDGYTSVSSEVLRVLPEHFDVHLGLISTADPDVERVDAWADHDGVDVVFDHWMWVDRTVEHITVSDADGNPVAGELEPVGVEPHSHGRMDADATAQLAPDGEPLARVFTFTPADGFDVGDELTVTVDAAAEAYHRRLVGTDRTFEVTVEPRPQPTVLEVTTVDGDGAALSGIDVVVGEHALTATTGDDGTVTFSTADFDDLPTGATALAAYATAYEPAERDLVIDDGQTHQVTLHLPAVEPDVTLTDLADDSDTDPDDPPTDVPGVSPDEGPGDAPAADVNEDSVHAPGIVWALEEGIADGFPDGTFRPGTGITRGQLATMLVAALDLSAAQPSFPDVPPTATHADAIGAASAAGIIEGFDDGTFRPGEGATRAQLASMLTRALQLEAGTADYPDVAADHVHAAGIGAASAAGIVEGLPDGSFDPDGRVTRGQVATMLYRALASR